MTGAVAGERLAKPMDLLPTAEGLCGLGTVLADARRAFCPLVMTVGEVRSLIATVELALKRDDLGAEFRNYLKSLNLK